MTAAMPDETGVTAVSGLRILVVEDTLLVAEVICAQLEGAGSIVIGPAARLPQALALARAEELDGAVLDVNLNGTMSFPLAALLEERQVPFIFLTGYDNGSVVPPEYRHVPRIAKPWHYATFLATVAACFRRAG